MYKQKNTRASRVSIEAFRRDGCIEGYSQKSFDTFSLRENTQDARRTKLCAFLAILITTILYSNANIPDTPRLIESVTAQKNKLQIYPTQEFRNAWLLEPYFFAEYDTDIEHLDKSVLIIPFVAITAPIIWATNSRYCIETLDEDYFFALQKIKKAYQLFYPSLSWSGEIVVEKLVKNGVAVRGERPSIYAAKLRTRDERGPRAKLAELGDKSIRTVTAITRSHPFDYGPLGLRSGRTDFQGNDLTGILFSGGLDAVCTSFANLDKNQLLITICGGDVRPQQEHMWENVQQQAKSFANIYGHQNSFIRSNFLTILNHDLLNTLSSEIAAWWGQTSQSISYTGLTAPLVIAKNCTELRMASTRTSTYPYAYGTHPVLDNCISYAGIYVVHDGAELDRMGKVQLIQRIVKEKNISTPILRVCWGKDEDGGNCCECEKCLRTINELLVEGADYRTYGFEVSLETIMQRTKKYFNKKLSMKAGLWWHWGCVQRRIFEQLEEENNNHTIVFDQKIRNYILWLSQINLDGFGCNREKLIVREQQRVLLSHLWQESLAGIPCF